MGRQAIADVFAGLMQGTQGELRIQEVIVKGDMANLLGIWELKGATNDRGRYIEVWRRGNGEWLIHRDIFNSSVPKE